MTILNLILSVPPSVDTTFGYSPGFERPLVMRGDFDAVKPQLLALGDSLAASIKKQAVKKDW